MVFVLRRGEKEPGNERMNERSSAQTSGLFCAPLNTSASLGPPCQQSASRDVNSRVVSDAVSRLPFHVPFDVDGEENFKGLGRVVHY